MTTHTDAVTAPLRARAQERGMKSTRIVLLVAMAALTLIAALTGRLESNLGDLENDVAAGKVSAVELQTLSPSLPTDNGFITVVWRDGVILRYVDV